MCVCRKSYYSLFPKKIEMYESLRSFKQTPYTNLTFKNQTITLLRSKWTQA